MDSARIGAIPFFAGLPEADSRSRTSCCSNEATSAVDNRTQASVTASLERLATRTVIAHRLSTIRSADQILMLEGGRVVQHGTYEELAGRPGPFADLARRQPA